MARLIDADKLSADHPVIVSRSMKFNLDLAPTVDAETVRRGRWEMDSDRPDTIICTDCDAGFDVWKHESKDFRFCPNCGARMDI